MNVDKSKYVGDIISKDGKNTETIKARVGRGIGIISVIMNILSNVSLGQYYFEIAVLLRETMFLSSILLSSESWVNVTKSDIKELESIDETLLRRILDAPAKTPLPALYMELGCLRIKHIIIKKRLMFLHNILNCEETRLVKKVFWAQVKSPVKNDLV